MIALFAAEAYQLEALLGSQIGDGWDVTEGNTYKALMAVFGFTKQNKVIFSALTDMNREIHAVA